MTEIVFEEPPAQKRGDGTWRRGKGKHADIAQTLKARPGQWAKVSTHASQTGSRNACAQIKSAYYAAYEPKGSFEAVSRSVDGEYRVYARFIGESSDG